MANKIKGLFVAVELDQTALTKGVKAAVNTLKTEFEGVKQAVDSSLKLDSSEINNKLSSVAKSLNRIQNAINTKVGGEAFADAVKESDSLKESLEEVAKQAGISSDLLRDTFSKAIKANQVKATVGEVRSLARTLGISSDGIQQFAKDLGVTGEALDKLAVKHEKATSRIAEVSMELKKLTGTDVTPSESEVANAIAVENSQKIVRNFKEYVRLMELSNEQALELAQRLGLSENVLEKVTSAYKESISVADKELEKLVSKINKLTGGNAEASGVDLERAIKTDKVKQLVDLMEQYKSVVGLSNEEVVKHAQKLGIAGSALDKLHAKYSSFAEQIGEELNATAKELTKLTGQNLGPTSKEFFTAAEVAKTNKIVDLVSRYARMLDLSEQEVRELGKQLNLTSKQMEKLVGEAEKLGDRTSGFLTGIKNLMTGGNAMAAIQSSLATLGANISVAGFTELGKSMMDTSVKVDSLRTAFTSIYKSASRASAQLDYIRSVTESLGLEFYSTAEAAKGFFAAAESSTIKGDAEDIFRAFSSASSALKMTQEQTNGVFLAISQMMSKGKISAEEMRQQLAERLPGAVQLLADAMGVSLKQLDKMFESGEVGIENLVKLAEKVEEIYGDAGVAASRALLGEMNKLKSAWIDFKSEFIRTDIVVGIIKNLQEGIVLLKENIDVLRKAVNSLIVAFGAFTLGKSVQGMISFAASITKGAHACVALVKGITSVRTALTVLSASLSGVTAGLSLIAGIAAYAWQSFKVGAEDAKYSVEDFKKGIDLTNSSVESVGSAAKSASNELRRLAEIRIEENLKKSQEELKSVEASFKNATTAILNYYKAKKQGGREVYDSNAPIGQRIRFEFDKNEFGSILKTVTEGLNYFDQELKEGRISSSYITAELKEWQKQVKDLGPQGERLYSILVDLEKVYLEAVLKNNKALEDRKSLLGEMAKTNIPENLETTSLISSKHALETIKKQAKNRGDFELIATIDLATSGDLENDKTGASQKKSYKELLDIIKSRNVEEKDLAYALQLELGLSQEAVAVAKEQARLLKEKTNTPLIEEYKSFNNELMSVNDSLRDMAKASEYGPESVAYGLYKITARADKARGEINKLDKDFKNIDPTKLKELQNLKLDLINKEEAAAIEAYFQKYKDAGKEAYHQLKELNGETNSAELESTLAKYDKILEGLRAWKDKEYELHKGNTEKLKQVDAEYALYVDAIEAQKAEARLRHSTKWEDGVKLGWRQYEKTATVTAEKVSDVTLKAFQGMGDALANFVTSADMSWKSMGEAFSNLAKSMINDITNIIAHATVMNSMKAMFGGTAFGSFLGMANGGVVNSGLSAYSNGVYNTPTFFNTNGGGIQRYANGGVFGEAGPEAIMPLTRMPNGRLGVAATGGGGGGDVQVNVYNNSNSKAEVRQSNSSGGGKSIDVIIGDVVAKQMSTPGSKLNRTVTTYTGGQQAVTRR